MGIFSFSPLVLEMLQGKKKKVKDCFNPKKSKSIAGISGRLMLKGQQDYQSSKSNDHQFSLHSYLASNVKSPQKCKNS